MSPFTFIFVIVLCCILVMKQSCVSGKLHKPSLEVLINDADDEITIGDTIRFNCTNSTNAQKFFLTKRQSNVTREQINSMFTITNVNIEDSGMYTCKYSWNSEVSEPSDPVDIYVSKIYPPPTITAEPRNIVQPGEDITIKCTAPYSHIIFTLYKGDTVVKEDDKNPFLYNIRNAEEKDVGQYSCIYRTKKDNELQIQSTFSNPTTIQIKELLRPFISWSYDPKHDTQLNISCRAPVKYRMMWFQLLNASKGIEEEINNVRVNEVTFVVLNADHSEKIYYCMYRIQIGDHFANSVISDPIITWGVNEGSQRIENIIRLLLSVLILIILCVIIVKHFNSFQEPKRLPPNLPPSRNKLAVYSDYSEMVIMKREDVLEKESDKALPNTDIYTAVKKVEDQKMLQSESKSLCSEKETTVGAAVPEKQLHEVVAELNLGNVYS
ncbi:immunoglobulin superfamily member 1-like isoform X2 [Mixophyes fleayi]|uniref:immunoglobulin superfamily member 1-like isoform X2 n=1 Tax=Mixophyes fleayi TaxID=3061075 RepID=UPI003F4D8CAF